MMLQTILFGTFMPPVTNPRRHLIDDKEIKVKAAPVKKPRVYDVPEAVAQNRLRMVEYVRANPGKSTAELCVALNCESRSNMRHFLLGTKKLGFISIRSVNYWYLKSDRPDCKDGKEGRVSHVSIVRKLLEDNPQGMTVKEIMDVTKKSQKATYDALRKTKGTYNVREANSIQAKWFLKGA